MVMKTLDADVVRAEIFFPERFRRGQPVTGQPNQSRTIPRTGKHAVHVSYCGPSQDQSILSIRTRRKYIYHHRCMHLYLVSVLGESITTGACTFTYLVSCYQQQEHSSSQSRDVSQNRTKAAYTPACSPAAEPEQC